MTLFYELANLNQAAQPLSMTGNYLNQFFVLTKLFISTFGTVAILIGAVIAIYRYLLYRFVNATKESLRAIRLDFARTIILGLEFFIASDVIETTIAPDFQSLGILCVLVIIRILLNYSLHKEVKALSEIPGSGIDAAD
ncbi:MAG: DUF1622 domain-containing protein [Coxiellaceae bacterium]|nr:DUF1622 domain-containing protein [Coxiellaceae bacterium]